jgi:hypothetical protein
LKLGLRAEVLIHLTIQLGGYIGVLMFFTLQNGSLGLWRAWQQEFELKGKFGRWERVF